MLEEWLHSYKPEELFDQQGGFIQELKELAPQGQRRMSANPVANGGLLRKPLTMPNFRDYAVEVTAPVKIEVENTRVLGKLLRDVMRHNMDKFRVFGPDETASNRLSAIYEVTPKGLSKMFASKMRLWGYADSMTIPILHL